MTQWQCWQCGKDLVGVILPFSRRQVCNHCNADQHVCRLCQHYRSNLSNRCDEDRAEDVSDKENANFCDYFSPKPHAYRGADETRQRAAKEKLDALFGDGPTEPGSNDGDDEKADGAKTKGEKAREALDDLFKS